MSRQPDEGRVARAVEAVEAEEECDIEGLIRRLQKSIHYVQADYFDTLRAQIGCAASRWLKRPPTV